MTTATRRECGLLTSPNGPENSDDLHKEVSEAELRIRAATPSLDLLQIRQGEPALLARHPAEELTTHDVGDEGRQADRRLIAERADLLAAERGDEHAQVRYCPGDAHA